MSLDQHLIHTCTIQNQKKATANVHGNADKKYDTPVTGVACRLVESREKTWSDERQESVVQTVYKLLLFAEASITERAIISQVTLEDGNSIEDRFVVTELLRRRSNSLHHKTAILERVS